MALSSHLPPRGRELELSSSSTWGRADQQTSRDSYESGAFCFARKNSLILEIPRGLFVPSIAPPSHLPDSGSGLELFLSSTWGRADQQTLLTQIESGAFCFAGFFSIPPRGPVRAIDSTAEPFTRFRVRTKVVLEQHLGEG